MFDNDNEKEHCVIPSTSKVNTRSASRGRKGSGEIVEVIVTIILLTIFDLQNSGTPISNESVKRSYGREE